MTLDFAELEKKINHRFANRDWLERALVHRSYLNEHPELKLEHNERLEFLGDAVLELAVTEQLFKKFPARPEGELTAFRAALVNTEMLAETAAALGVGDFLLLSRGESRDAASRARQQILANALEAIIGAIYLDGGYAAAARFIIACLWPKLDAILANNLWQDSKSALQEKAQANRNITPTYKIISAVGPDHGKTFTVGVYLGEELVAEGAGPSKQRAEQEAARAGLEKLNWN